MAVIDPVAELQQFILFHDSDVVIALTPSRHHG